MDGRVDININITCTCAGEGGIWLPRERGGNEAVHPEQCCSVSFPAWFVPLCLIIWKEENTILGL